MIWTPRGRGQPLLLRGGTALVGEELVERPFDSMLVADGRVVAFDQEAEDAVVVDLHGGWVVPGLVDAHVHLELTAAAAPFEQWDRPPVQRMSALIRNGLVALAAGIVSVRDLGSVDDSVIEYGRMTESGRVLGPNVVAAGQAVAMTGGHLWRYSRQADGPSEVRRAVREQIRSGATVVKVMATGGLTTPGEPGSPELGEDELRAAVATAGDAGLGVAAHAHGAEGLRAAVRAGVSTIEHGGLLTEEDCAAVRAAGIILVPTLSPVLRLPAGEAVAPDVVEKTHAIRPRYMRNIAAAIRDGVTIAAGTDAGCAFNPIGGVADEVVEYVALGMTPEQALRSVTVTAARVLGLPGGTVEPGGPADLVVLAEDPRGDIAALRSPRQVIRSGQLLDPAGLEATIAALGGRDEARPMASAAALLGDGGSR